MCTRTHIHLYAHVSLHASNNMHVCNTIHAQATRTHECEVHACMDTHPLTPTCRQDPTTRSGSMWCQLIPSSCRYVSPVPIFVCISVVYSSDFASVSSESPFAAAAATAAVVAAAAAVGVAGGDASATFAVDGMVVGGASTGCAVLCDDPLLLADVEAEAVGWEAAGPSLLEACQRHGMAWLIGSSHHVQDGSSQRGMLDCQAERSWCQASAMAQHCTCGRCTRP